MRSVGVLFKVELLREIAHHYKHKAEEWFCKYMKYMRHEEVRILCLLLRQQEALPLPIIAGLDLAQGPKTRSSAFEADKERKNFRRNG